MNETKCDTCKYSGTSDEDEPCSDCLTAFANVPFPLWEPKVSRIDIIGQNGNDGLHYEQTEEKETMGAVPEHALADKNCHNCYYKNVDSGKWPCFACEFEEERGQLSLWQPREDTPKHDEVHIHLKDSTPEPKPEDRVYQPNHYMIIPEKDVEVIDVIRAALTEEEFRGYCKGNMMKYLCRAHKKNGEEDERKAGQYADFLRSSKDED